MVTIRRTHYTSGGWRWVSFLSDDTTALGFPELLMSKGPDWCLGPESDPFSVLRRKIVWGRSNCCVRPPVTCLTADPSTNPGDLVRLGVSVVRKCQTRGPTVVRRVTTSSGPFVW